MHFYKSRICLFFATFIFLAQLTKSANPNSILSENLSVISGVRRPKKLIILLIIKQLNGVKDFFPAFFLVFQAFTSLSLYSMPRSAERTTFISDFYSQFLFSFPIPFPLLLLIMFEYSVISYLHKNTEKNGAIVLCSEKNFYFLSVFSLSVS